MSTIPSTDPVYRGQSAPPQVIIQQQAPTAFGRYGKLLIAVCVCLFIIWILFLIGALPLHVDGDTPRVIVND